MSRSVNRVTLLGNVGSDPEVRAAGGSRVASFSLATGRQWKDAGGEKQEKTEWHKCVAWNTKAGTVADIVEKYVKKGDRLYVEGEIEYRQWVDKDGVTKYMTEIKVRDITLLGGKSGPGEMDTGGRQSAPVVYEKRASKSGDPDFPAALDDDLDGLPF